MDSVKQLISKKDDIEAEIKVWHDILDSNKSVGTKGPLVDNEGYPRSDIDVHQVTIARNKLVHLQNDHKNIMHHIEEELKNLHQAKKNLPGSLQSEEPMQVDDVTSSSRDHSRRGFAAVDIVSRGSPAEEAGLKVGDVILSFGSISKHNFTGLQCVGEVVQHSVGRGIRVEIKRENEDDEIVTLTPKQWSGRGLLGCNIVPL